MLKSSERRGAVDPLRGGVVGGDMEGEDEEEV